MAAIDERVARIEGGYEHLVTKADIARLEGEMKAMESRLIRWIVVVMVLWGGALIAAMQFIPV